MTTATQINNIINHIPHSAEIFVNIKHKQRENMSDDHGARGLDFQIGDWRVIREDTITQVMKDQFESDLWVVGCASAEFLSRVTGLSSYIFEALQKRDAQEEIGMIIQDMNKLDDYVDEIIKGEGYGPHFASYDGQKHEVKYLGNYWYLFQVG